MLELHGTLARAALSLACSAALLAAPGAARAQERDPAAAQALFDQARELSKQGRFAEACPKLQESNRLDPGIGTQFHLADCYEQLGRIASAWAAFLDVASQARATGQVDREKAAQRRAERLQPRLPRLVIEVPDASKAPGLELRRNGVVVGSAQWSVPVPVDPGEIEIAASAPGKQSLRQSLRLEEGKTASYSLPALRAEEAAPAAAAVPAEKGAGPVVGEPQSSPATPPVAPPRDGAAVEGSGNTVWILALAGAGVAGLGVGTAFAVMAKNQYEDSKSGCPNDPNICNQAGFDLRKDARSKGNVATVGFIAGGAFLSGAAILWLASGSSPEERKAQRGGVRASAELLPGHAGLSLQGSF